MPDTENAPESSSSSNLSKKSMRITSHGKMKHWIASSLSFLGEESNENKTLILHTLPASVDPEAGYSNHERVNPSSVKRSISTGPDLIPRLLSVVEIIKREYMAHLNSTKSSRMTGLHQYNEVGTLEDLGINVNSSADDVVEEDHVENKRVRNIIEALKGKNHPRQIQTPFMRITLSLEELPELVEGRATYQPPPKRKQSKSAKSRAKKRAKILEKDQSESLGQLVVVDENMAT